METYKSDIACYKELIEHLFIQRIHVLILTHLFHSPINYKRIPTSLNTSCPFAKDAANTTMIARYFIFNYGNV